MTTIAAVTGATGFIGPAVIGALLGDGCAVRALSRREMPSHVPAGLTIVLGDIGEESRLRSLFSGADVVHHLAGLAHTSRRGADFAGVNVGGTRNVVRAASAAGVRHVVFYSTIAVYGATAGGDALDEESPLRPDTDYARSKAEAERAVRDSLGDGATILRLAAVYGPGLKGNYLRLTRAILGGRYLGIGPGTNRRTLVFLEDVGLAARLVTRAGPGTERVYNVTDGAVHPVRDIVATIARCAGKEPPRGFLPVPMARIGARLLEPLRVVGLPASPSALVEKYLEDVAVLGERIQAELGFQPRVDLREGWCRVVAALREG